MQTAASYSEKRSAERSRSTGRVWWIGQENEAFREGWMFDTSRSGIAFLAQADNSPSITEKVAISENDPNPSFADCETLRVARVESHGPAFNLVGCTRSP